MASGFGESDGLEESPLADQARSSLFQNLDSSHRIEEISFDRAFNDLDQGWIVGGTFDRPRLYRNVSESGASTAGPLMGSLSETCGFLPPTPPSSLGDRSFIRAHGLNQAYVGGSMANGIASVDLVSSLVKAGNLAFYGAAGQTPDRVDFALQELERRNRGGAWGCNLIHSPAEPTIESEVARLLGLRRVRHVEASAYLDLTEPLVKLRIQSLHREPSGEIVPRISIMAKASRLEVASKFLSPAPAEWISRLLEQGEISSEQAQWAKEWPICDDLTAEADSGGHTDNRPLTTLVPAFCDLRDRIGANLPRALGVRVGAAGGLGTPAAIASALALGAGYVVIGSVHQACIESGSSQLVRDMLAQAGPADVIMAPASDMFEMGVHLQVLRRGTMFGTRARRLLELYRKHTCIEEIPIEDRQRIEKEIFRMPLEEVWAYTRDFFLEREPKQVERAETDAHHRMALIFRWYLGKSSDWANHGDPDRVLDYQVWCGPAMGAFNEWVRGSFLEIPEERRVAVVSRSLMEGAALRCRANDLQRLGYQLPAGSWFDPATKTDENSAPPVNFNDRVRNPS